MEGGRSREQLLKGYGLSFWGHENVLELYRGKVVVAQRSECTKCHGIVHFKMVNFMLCQFHFELKRKLRKGRIQRGRVLIERDQIPQKSKQGYKLRGH